MIVQIIIYIKIYTNITSIIEIIDINPLQNTVLNEIFYNIKDRKKRKDKKTEFKKKCNKYFID